jgi:hypothetical protein
VFVTTSFGRPIRECCGSEFRSVKRLMLSGPANPRFLIIKMAYHHHTSTFY